VKTWLLSGRPAVILAWLSAVTAIGQWVVFVPVLAMGVVAGSFYIALFFFTFLALPIGAATAVAAALVVRRRPRLASVLLLLTAVGLAYPLGAPLLIPLTGAALAFLASKTPEVRTQIPGTGGRGATLRALGIGAAVAVSAIIVAPMVVVWALGR